MLAKHLNALIRAIFCPIGACKLTSHSLRPAIDFKSCLKTALARVSPETREYDQKPILLSASWRLGSMLVQSMLMEHKQSAIIWSEPLDHCKIHECIANQLRAFISRRPFERFFFSKRQQRNLSAEWVPSLYLDVDFLLNAHRGFFGRPFGEFDRAIDRSNCGIKEARPTIDRVMHFRVRHPRCKIVILYRNPYDADLSRRHVKAGKFRRRSDDWVKTADADDQHWPETTHSFIKGHERVNDPLIRYEDLDNPVGIDRLSDYLAWPVSRSSILRRRDLAKKQERSVTLARLDKAILDFATGRTRKDAGY